MRAAIDRRTFACVAAVWLAGCTFAGIADFEVEQCDPNVTSLASDACNRLNGADSCSPYQCDAATRRCLKAPRDFDRDGDPDTACGGTDCDDEDAGNSGVQLEQCDGADNDCDGLIDEGVLAAGNASEVKAVGLLGSPAEDEVGFVANDGNDLRACFVNNLEGGCLQHVDLPGGQELDCTFLSSNNTLNARQPYTRKMGGYDAAAFVAIGNCPQGALEVRIRSGAGTGEVTRACAAVGAGSALPALAPLPGDTPDHLVLSWYRIPFAERDSRFGDCEGAASGPLLATSVLAATSPSPALGTAAITLATDALSLSPPAMLTSVAAGGVWVASATEGGVLVWLVQQDPNDANMLVASESPVAVPGSAGARAVALASRPGSDQLAVAMEMGCTPQAIRVALGTWDGSALSFADAAEVVPAGTGLAGRPELVWAAPRGGWQLTFVAGPPATIKALQLSADGAASSPLDVLQGATAGASNGQGDVFVFAPDAAGNRFLHVPLACPGG